MKKSLLILLVGFGLTSSAAFAESSTASNHPTKMGHAYFGVQIGFGGMQLGTTTNPDNDNPGQMIETSSDILTRVSAGYLFQVSPSFSVGPEFGYERYEDYNYSIQRSDGHLPEYTYKGHLFDLLAKNVYSFNSSFSMFGKIGVALVTQSFVPGQLITQNDSTKVSKSTSKVLPKIAIGLNYNITPQLSISTSLDSTFGGAEVDPFGGKVSSLADLTKVADVSAIMLGVNYSFK